MRMMRYLLTESEALLIKEKFGFGQLLGLNTKQRIKLWTERELRNKNVIYSNNGKDELSNEYRALFSNWEKMRYSIVRPELNDKTHLQCILSNDKVLIFFARKKDVITIDLIDFSEEKLDEMIIAFSEMIKTEAKYTMFNLTLSLDEYERIINSKDRSDLNEWNKAIGLDVDVLEKFLENINTKNEAQMLLVEDHISDCGYMSKIVNTEDGIYAVKHVTHKENQKMVMIYGSTQYVTNSIYNF